MPEFRIGGTPPGETYQSIALNVGPAENIMGSMIRTIGSLERQGNARDAAKVRALQLYYIQRIRAIAITTAEVFEEKAKSKLHRTQRRPDSERGGVKLVDTIKAVAWEPTPQFAFGWVSMGLHDELNKAVNPRTGGIYWRVQERGWQYSHTPTGFFLAGPGYGGGTSRPNMAQAGLHPLFVVSSKGGTFRHPPRLRARRYLWEGSKIAVAHWQREMRRFDRDFARKYERLTATIFGHEVLRGLG